MTASTSATQHQRATITAQLAAAGYYAQTVTRKYRRLGADDSFVGRPVAHWLDSLRFPEAQAAIRQLDADALAGMSGSCTPRRSAWA